MKHIIDLSHPNLSILSGHLKMGGSNPQGVEINANNRYLTLGGNPWLPVMGEFHFSRYPQHYWRQELLKMKAGRTATCATSSPCVLNWGCMLIPASVPGRTWSAAMVDFRIGWWKNAPIYMAPENRPEFSESSEVLQVRSIHAVPEYGRVIEFPLP